MKKKKSRANLGDLKIYAAKFAETSDGSKTFEEFAAARLAVSE